MTTNAKCLIVQPIHQIGIDILRRAGITPILCPDPSPETVLRMISGCFAVITRDAGLNAEAIAASGTLRVIAVHGTGHDTVDKSAAMATGTIICTTPGANARSVAELTLGLSLALARRIPAADRAVRDSATGYRERECFIELKGKTALIIGWGHIGRLVGAMFSSGLGMKILAFSPHVADIRGADKVHDLYAGLAKAHLISLHTPLRPETDSMIDSEAFAAMRPGALLVNTARARLIDEAALADALDYGVVAGAALDLFSADAPTGPLGCDPRVILTPHLGGTTEEALARTAEAAAQNVISVLNGTKPDTALGTKEYLP